MTPLVEIIVLNWNGLSDTVNCLTSLQGLDYPNYSVIVVDNGSVDGSVEAIQAQFPAVTLIETGVFLQSLDYFWFQAVNHIHLVNHGSCILPTHRNSHNKQGDGDQ